jgi:CRISPR-associated endoribonuclease Cas6
MPYELIIPLLVQKPWRPTFRDQRAMHAVFMDVISDVDSDIADTIHPQQGQYDDQIRPFTQTLRSGRQGMTWRITLLEDSLYGTLDKGLNTHGPLQIDHRTAAVNIDAVTCRHLAYSELAGSPVCDEYTFAFETPTSFKQVNRHYPIPDPYHCFLSWWTRWDAFAPPEHGINIAVRDIVQEHLAISRFILKSRLAEDGPRRIIGSVGEITFRPLRMGELEPLWSQAIATLAAFAPLCGTGHKTTQGMGQTALLV